ncbi:MAG: Secretion system C-terminal sorting domain, partial [Bacteroidota bacterium]
IKTHFSPNPTNDLLHITANQPFKYLKITDLLGKTQIEKTVNSTETIISTAELPQGVYIGLIDGIFIQKIIVLH